jgi:hypothetical protein
VTALVKAKEARLLGSAGRLEPADAAR